MGGHSHFHNIKHKKAANDSKKSKILAKISKEIKVAIKNSSKDPNENSKLRIALEKARLNNVPKDNIERILNSSSKDDKQLFEITYEGYGPNGVALIVDCLTDNVNRTAAEVRSTFSKSGGNLGIPGSVSYMFDTIGVLAFEDKYLSLEQAELIALENDSLDIKVEDNVILIETDRKKMIAMKEILTSAGVEEFLEASILKVPSTKIELNEQQFESLEKMISILEDLDDVNSVFHNAE